MSVRALRKALPTAAPTRRWSDPLARPKKTERSVPIRERLLAAAASHFAEHGYHGASLARIAESVGIRAPSLLYHFPSKDALYVEVVRDFYTRLRADFESAHDPSAEFATSMLALLGVLRGLQGERRDLLVTLVSEVLRDGRGADVIEQAVAPLMEQMEGQLTAMAEQAGVADAPIRQLITLLVLAYVLSLEGEHVPPALDRLRKTVWGTGDHIGKLAPLLLRGVLAGANPAKG